MNKKVNFRKNIGLLFAVIGICCIVFPIYFYVQQGREIEQLHEKLNLIQQSEITHIEKKEESLGQVMMLSIPSIDLYQPILETLSDDHLNVALTQIKENQVLGSGNFTVAGHLSSVDGRHFNRLPEVKIGDEVSVLTDKQVYTFTVDSREVIEATDVDVLDDGGRSEITLITCTPSGKKRLAVKGYLVGVEDIPNK